MALQILFGREIVGMELNETEKIAIEIKKIIMEIMGDRIDDPEIYGIVNVSPHCQFEIRFVAYDYFPVVFNYEQGIIGCSIKCGKHCWISLVKGQHCYSRTDFNAYFSEAKKELELRIPDKYLIAKGWKA